MGGEADRTTPRPRLDVIARLEEILGAPLSVADVLDRDIQLFVLIEGVVDMRSSALRDLGAPFLV